MDKYDLVVIGSGVGLNILNTAIEKDWKCVLVEDTKIGGTCLTRGCIPSKILVHPADLIREAEHAKKVGLKFKLEEFNWSHIAERMWSQINESNEIEKSLKTISTLTLFKGAAEFTGEYEMEIKAINREKIGKFKGKKIVLASGARSLIPPIKGIEEVGYVTNETFFGEKFPKHPWKSLIIIGGGVIAAEYAHIFSAFGTNITIVEMLPHLVTTEEPEISAFLENYFSKWMTVMVNYRAIRAYKENNIKVVVCENSKTNDIVEIKAEEIFVAAGRRSNADILKVEKTGVQTDKQGWITTNEYLETTKKNIWCVGDANGIFQFRHKANYEAEICANNIFNEYKMQVDYSAVPWAIFTYPQIGHVGMTEAEAIEKGHEIYVAKKHYSSVAKGFAMGYDQDAEDDGFVKLIIDKYYRILGAHVVGPHAAELVQPFVYLMNSGFTCILPKKSKKEESLPKIKRACPDAGSFMPIYQSMVIHPSLSEVAAWAIGSLKPINIKHEHHDHDI